MTEPRYILDSNILIYVLGGGPMGLRERIEAHAPGSVVTSSLSYAEVMRGIDASDDGLEEGARLMFQIFPVLPFDRAAADRYRSIPFRRGRFDHLIAAHALALDLTLVTNDVGDFADIPGLRIENWTQ